MSIDAISQNKLRTVVSAPLAANNPVFSSGAWGADTTTITSKTAGVTLDAGFDVTRAGRVTIRRHEGIQYPSTSGTVYAESSIEVMSPAAATTAAVLEAGTKSGQVLWVLNMSGNTVQFAAVATSNVAGGVFETIPSLSAAAFIWENEGATNRIPAWYRVRGTSL